MADKPLIIEYDVRENDIYIGWGLDKDKIRCDLPLGIGKGSEGIRLLKKEHRLESTVKESVKTFFNMNKDIHIPKSYPYKIFKVGEDKPLSEGTLRD